MARRSRRILRYLYAKRQARSTSRADGPGYIYAFVDRRRRFKIGMTKNFAQRRAQWDKQCPSSTRRWMPPIAVKSRRRAEALAHLSLEFHCADRPKIRCGHCRKKHVEVFVFAGNGSVVWNNLVYPLLQKAARA
ncbi:hypothetical protein FB446DRAFT_793263 [Lentinula raphanica]|nr:hypothetical protein FB446DRAFT_793263 [Lentinula raphanica]KAJ3816685.1 hypothetical protein F5880DRAFT_1619046 [Lentinula raphanica]